MSNYRAYNLTWIRNRAVVQQADRWHRQGLLTSEQAATVRQAYPVGFRQTGGFLDFGLFLFTTLAILGSYLLLTTFTRAFDTTLLAFGWFNLFCGLAAGGVGQYLIKEQKLYRNGIDNAFAIMLTGFVVFGLNQLFFSGIAFHWQLLFMLPVLLAILWYYGDTLVAFLVLSVFYGFVFTYLIQFGWGKTVLPFVLMGLSAALYGSARWLAEHRSRTLYYADALMLTQWIALIVATAAGNYYLGRELNGLLLKPRPATAPEIALPLLFWALTFGLPAAYLWLGFSRKNRTMLIMGAFGVAAAVATFRHYHALLPLNWALTFDGLLLIGLSVAGIHALRNGPQRGFTDTADDDSPDNLLANAQTLSTLQTMSGGAHRPAAGPEFGGGTFGGGGAGERY